MEETKWEKLNLREVPTDIFVEEYEFSFKDCFGEFCSSSITREGAMSVIAEKKKNPEKEYYYRRILKENMLLEELADKYVHGGHFYRTHFPIDSMRELNEMLQDNIKRAYIAGYSSAKEGIT
jgi:hypothetical protein